MLIIDEERVEGVFEREREKGKRAMTYCFLDVGPGLGFLTVWEWRRRGHNGESCGAGFLVLVRMCQLRGILVRGGGVMDADGGIGVRGYL